MADLDSFFAKKDKKKKKGKEKKFPTTSATSMAKTLEASSTGAETPSNKPDKDVMVDMPATSSQDDEWHQEEEQVQDLEGLKVQALRLDGEDKSQSRGEAREPTDGDDEDVDGGEEGNTSNVSVWQKKVPAPSATGVIVESPSDPPASDKPSGAYIPPSRRLGGAPTTSRRSHNVPPDIQNASAFPSLQASVQTSGKEKSVDKDFKEVRSHKGGRSSDSPYEAPGLELTNKYSALLSN